MSSDLENEWKALLAQHREANIALQMAPSAKRREYQGRLFAINRRIRVFIDQEQQARLAAAPRG